MPTPFAYPLLSLPPFALALLVAVGEAAAISQTAAAVTVSTKKTVNVMPILTLLLLDWSRGMGQIERRDYNSFVGGNLTLLTTQVKRGFSVH